MPVDQEGDEAPPVGGGWGRGSSQVLQVTPTCILMSLPSRACFFRRVFASRLPPFVQPLVLHSVAGYLVVFLCSVIGASPLRCFSQAAAAASGEPSPTSSA
eukprot:1982927-Alexandrium_andersonii.AAC.1